MDLFSDDLRRNPYPAYAQLRAASPLFREPQSGLWMVLDYDGVRRVLSEHASFSSHHGPADWMIFQDPPQHTKLRALISKAFTPRSVANLESRIAAIVRELLDRVAPQGAMDLAADFAIPLPMRVIAEMLGIPPTDRARFERWNDVLLRMSYLVVGSPGALAVMTEFGQMTAEVSEYVAALLAQRRRADPQHDLLTRLAQADFDGERLTHGDIVGFVQLLLLAGSETTTNLINNAILCFIEHPDQLALLRQRMDLLPSAIEEVLRFRAPLQWMYRMTTRDVELDGQALPPGTLLLAVIGSANRDPRAFADPERFDVTRDPNPHLAFGHGNHFCLGAPLARLEARVALAELIGRFDAIERASDGPWEPRPGLHVHGPAQLPIRFRSRGPAASA
jgi:cytochrome P450